MEIGGVVEWSVVAVGAAVAADVVVTLTHATIPNVTYI